MWGPSTASIFAVSTLPDTLRFSCHATRNIHAMPTHLAVAPPHGIALAQMHTPAAILPCLPVSSFSRQPNALALVGPLVLAGVPARNLPSRSSHLPTVSLLHVRPGALPGTLAGARKTTPFGSSSSHFPSANHATQSPFRIAARGQRQSWAPTTSPTSQTAIMPVRPSRPSSSESLPKPQAFFFISLLPYQSPRRISPQYRVAGRRLPILKRRPSPTPANGLLATPRSPAAVAGQIVSLTPSPPPPPPPSVIILTLPELLPLQSSARVAFHRAARLSAPIPCSEFEPLHVRATTSCPALRP